MKGENPQLCPFTGLSCPFLSIPHTYPYFPEQAVGVGVGQISKNLQNLIVSI